MYKVHQPNLASLDSGLKPVVEEEFEANNNNHNNGLSYHKVRQAKPHLPTSANERARFIQT